MRHLTSIAAIASLLLVASHARSQDGFLAGKSAFVPEGNPFSLNTEAYDTLASGNFDRMLGKMSDQRIFAGYTFDTETVIWGKKVAQLSFTPTVSLIGPMFGGESYLTLSAILPVENQYADQYYITSGWKYRVTPVLDVDIGGNTVLLDKTTYGPGVVSPFGTAQRNDLYFGAIARVPFEPSLYVVYDTIIEQLMVVGGVNYSIPVGKYLHVDALTFEVQGRAGYLKADAWLGSGESPTGAQWTNSYFYGSVKGDLVYRFQEGLKVNAGVRYAGNTDGTGNHGISGLNLGPDNMVWFGLGMGYEW